MNKNSDYELNEPLLASGKYTNYVGILSERAFSYECAKRSIYCVSNIEPWLPFDSIVRHPKNNRFYTVQSKSTQLLSGYNGISRVKLDRRVSAPLRNGAKDPLYKEGDFDYLHIHIRNYDEHYLIPWKTVYKMTDGKSSIGVYDSDYTTPTREHKSHDLKKYKKWFDR